MDCPEVFMELLESCERFFENNNQNSMSYTCNMRNAIQHLKEFIFWDGDAISRLTEFSIKCLKCYTIEVEDSISNRKKIEKLENENENLRNQVINLSNQINYKSTMTKKLQSPSEQVLNYCSENEKRLFGKPLSYLYKKYQFYCEKRNLVCMCGKNEFSKLLRSTVNATWFPTYINGKTVNVLIKKV